MIFKLKNLLKIIIPSYILRNFVIKSNLYYFNSKNKFTNKEKVKIDYIIIYNKPIINND